MEGSFHSCPTLLRNPSQIRKPCMLSPPPNKTQDAMAAKAAAYSSMRADLQRLLRERGALDSLKALVAGALGGRGSGSGGG